MIRTPEPYDPMRSTIRDIGRGDNNVGFVKCHANNRTFFYVRFFVGKSDSSSNSFPEVMPVHSSTTVLTVMLGNIPDGSTDFVIADDLYAGLSGEWGTAIDPRNLPSLAAALDEALAVAAARLTAAAKKMLLSLDKWIDQPTDYLPISMATLERYAKCVRLLLVIRADRFTTPCHVTSMTSPATDGFRVRPRCSFCFEL